MDQLLAGSTSGSRRWPSVKLARRRPGRTIDQPRGWLAGCDFTQISGLIGSQLPMHLRAAIPGDASVPGACARVSPAFASHTVGTTLRPPSARRAGFNGALAIPHTLPYGGCKIRQWARLMEDAALNDFGPQPIVPTLDVAMMRCCIAAWSASLIQVDADALERVDMN